MEKLYSVLDTSLVSKKRVWVAKTDFINVPEVKCKAVDKAPDNLPHIRYYMPYCEAESLMSMGRVLVKAE